MHLCSSQDKGWQKECREEAATRLQHFPSQSEERNIRDAKVACRRGGLLPNQHLQTSAEGVKQIRNYRPRKVLLKVDVGDTSLAEELNHFCTHFEIQSTTASLHPPARSSHIFTSKTVNLRKVLRPDGVRGSALWGERQTSDSWASTWTKYDLRPMFYCGLQEGTAEVVLPQKKKRSKFSSCMAAERKAPEGGHGCVKSLRWCTLGVKLLNSV